LVHFPLLLLFHYPFLISAALIPRDRKFRDHKRHVYKVTSSPSKPPKLDRRGGSPRKALSPGRKKETETKQEDEKKRQEVVNDTEGDLSLELALQLLILCSDSPINNKEKLENVEDVTRLIQAGVDLNARDQSGATGLCLSFERQPKVARVNGPKHIYFNTQSVICCDFFKVIGRKRSRRQLVCQGTSCLQAKYQGLPHGMSR